MSRAEAFARAAELVRDIHGNDALLHELVAKLTGSPDCEKVWSALERRSRAHQDRQYDYLTKNQGEPASVAKELISEFDLASEIVQLAYVVGLADQPKAFQFTATVAQRRKLAVRFRKAAKVIHECTALLWDGQEFDSISTALQLHSVAIAKMLQEASNLGEWEQRVITITARNCIHGYEDTLRVLEAAVDEWSRQPPITSRPRAPTAARLVLIRDLTKRFKSRFGSPLRSSVLAVVGVFYDCSDMDESTIAKLAP